MNLGDRYYMPCWRWENLDEKFARLYASRHSRLFCQGQLSLWNSDRSKATNLINNNQQPRQQLSSQDLQLKN